MSARLESFDIHQLPGGEDISDVMANTALNVGNPDAYVPFPTPEQPVGDTSLLVSRVTMVSALVKARRQYAWEDIVFDEFDDETEKSVLSTDIFRQEMFEDALNRNPDTRQRGRRVRTQRMAYEASEAAKTDMAPVATVVYAGTGGERPRVVPLVHSSLYTPIIEHALHSGEEGTASKLVRWGVDRYTGTEADAERRLELLAEQSAPALGLMLPAFILARASGARHTIQVDSLPTVAMPPIPERPTLDSEEL